ncbi:MAG: HEPN domain-containing protein [Gemmataceae bacterium]|nr:HEPN domain-containing protein [Gemmataceae bacterium]
MSRLIETRAEFQQLAEERLVEAKALLNLSRWDGAYYLAGYAVELALKACIIKGLMATDAFPDKEFSRNCYTHAIDKLVGLARLADELKVATSADAVFQANWNLARDWTEEKRYHRMTQAETEALYTAIADAAHGVFQWIKARW